MTTDASLPERLADAEGELPEEIVKTINALIWEHKDCRETLSALAHPATAEET